MSAMSIVRVAMPGDAQRLADLAEVTFRDTFAATNSHEDMALHCRRHYGEAIQAAEIADPGVLTLLCEDSARLVGYAQLHWSAAPACVVGHSPGEIHRLYVAGDCHGRGIAQALMSECLRRLRERGSDVVWLGVWERNPRAIAFYRKVGFVPVGEHVFTLGVDRQRDVLMARALRPEDRPPG